MVEPIREHTYSLSAYLDATKEEDIRETRMSNGYRDSGIQV